MFVERTVLKLDMPLKETDKVILFYIKPTYGTS